MIDLGLANGEPLPENIRTAFASQMAYTHIRHLHGADKWDPITGIQRNIETTRVLLHKIIDGRITTCCGYIPRILRTAQELGCTVDIQDLTPEGSNTPGAYETDWENVHDRVQFRVRQEECLRAVADNPGGIIKAPPAFGKSHLIAAIAILYPRAKIHVVIKRRDLVERTVRTLRGVLPQVGVVRGGEYKPSRVTVFTAASLHRSEGDADILICDEVHELMSPSYSEALARTYKFSRNFGLSATPEGRADNADAKLEYLFGPLIFDMPWQEATELGLIVPIEARWVPIRMARNPAQGRKDVAKKRWGIWRNEYRNAVIGHTVRQHGDDEQVLILVETIEHAVNLWQRLPEYELCYAEMEMDDLERYKRNGLLPESYEPMTGEKRSALRVAFENHEVKKVIATDVWSTGVSFERLAVLVRADARGSEIMDTQAPGRVARIHEASGKDKGIVYDFYDHFDRGFKSKSRTRRKNYANKGWEQVDFPAPEILDA
jgi:superfamily II DNA or RNA helicase